MMIDSFEFCLRPDDLDVAIKKAVEKAYLVEKSGIDIHVDHIIDTLNAGVTMMTFNMLIQNLNEKLPNQISSNRISGSQSSQIH